MNLKPIFVDDITGEGLYAMVYKDGIDEYENIFKKWDDVEYVLDYCVSNESYLDDDHFRKLSIGDIAKIIGKESERLQILLKESAHANTLNTVLDRVFIPLHSRVNISIPSLQESKAFIDEYGFKNPILRVYGIRIAPNTYVVTGGAIKITKAMQDHPDTDEELQKFKTAKKFLQQQGLDCEDDLLNYFSDDDY